MKKSFKIAIVCSLIVGIICCLCLLFMNHVLLNGKLVNCSTEYVVVSGNKLPSLRKLQRFEQLKCLDLREVSISVSDYEKLCEQLSDCDILWNVPFQGAYLDNQTEEITVNSMTVADVELLNYLPNLKRIDGRNCANYDVLMDLAQTRPDLHVRFSVDMGAYLLNEETEECVITDKNVDLLLSVLSDLPNLHVIDARECTDYDAVMQIRECRPDITLNYSVKIGSTSYDGDEEMLNLDISDAEQAAKLLQYFPNLTKVTFKGLAADNELMYQLKCSYPNVVIEWEFELFGVKTSSTATELLLNQIPMDSVEPVEDALKYFYNLQWVEMCRCGISSEEMDALWKRHPETRFVWEIPMGSGYVRTDAKSFIPFKYGYDINNPFYDTQAKELKYLVDLECLDLGHMRMNDISFLQYMPKLRFLILADTVCKDFSYIAGLTELVFLELFRSEIQDVNLLMNMTKLEDLNIGWTNLKNPEQLMEMKWLKRLWASMNGMNYAQFCKLEEALPDTYVYTNSLHPTEGGWRESKRYFEMRDLLGMFYMT